MFILGSEFESVGHFFSLISNKFCGATRANWDFVSPRFRPCHLKIRARSPTQRVGDRAAAIKKLLAALHALSSLDSTGKP